MLETVCLFLFLSGCTVETFNIAISCFHILEITRRYFQVLMFNLQFGITFPCLSVHLIYSAVDRTGISAKTLSLAAYALCVSSMFLMDLRMHALEMPSSTLLSIVATQVVILIAAVIFTIVFRRILLAAIET